MLTDQQKLDLVKRYLAGESISAIAADYGVTYQSCWRLLKTRGVKNRRESHLSNRKYTFDTAVFDQINTETKAYWLGFIYADGCHFEKRYSLLVALSTKDEDHLSGLASLLSLNRPLYRRTDNDGHSSSLLTATDMHMSRSLTALGVMSAKTFKLTFPTTDQVPPHLVRHFIRGYFDGDGCITSSNRTPDSKPDTTVSFVGTEAFISKVAEIARSVTGYGGNITTRHPERNHNIRTFAIHGNGAVETYLDWLYQDATVFLPRKEQRYQELKRLNKLYWKPVEQLDLDGNLLATFISTRDAAAKTGFRYLGIEGICNGSSCRYDRQGNLRGKNTTYRGYVWRYGSNPYAN